MTTNETLSRKVDALQSVVYALVALVLLLVITAVVGIPQVISVSNRSNNTAARANEASTDAQQAVKQVSRISDCLVDFGSDFVNALNARTSDTAKYQEADDARDRVLVKLLTATSIDDQRILGTELLKVTKAKQQALKEIRDGREDKAYPDPPREVCPAS